MMIKYKTSEIYIKEIEIDEIDEKVIEWFNDQELMKFYTNSKNKITKEILITSITSGKKNGNIYTFGIYDIKSDKLFGTLKLGPINFNQMHSDLVILIGEKDFNGKGLAVQAIKLGNRIAFEKFNLRKLFGGMYESNKSSIKAYSRANWIIEGRLKGHYLVDEISEDRILVGCFNPKYFSDSEIQTLKQNEGQYFQF